MLGAGDPDKQMSTLELLDLKGVGSEFRIGLTCVAYEHPLVKLPFTVEVKGGT